MSAPEAGPTVGEDLVDEDLVDGPVLRGIVVGVLCADAALLALTELAWIWLRVGAVPLPVAALVALVSTPLLVLAAGAAMPGSRAPLVVLGAWLLPLVIGLAAGLLPLDWRGVVLLGCGVVPGLLMANRRPGMY